MASHPQMLGDRRESPTQVLEVAAGTSIPDSWLQNCATNCCCVKPPVWWQLLQQTQKAGTARGGLTWAFNGLAPSLKAVTILSAI